MDVNSFMSVKTKTSKFELVVQTNLAERTKEILNHMSRQNIGIPFLEKRKKTNPEKENFKEKQSFFKNASSPKLGIS